MDNIRVDCAVSRVSSTPAANKLINELRENHGALMFHQSGGCCDGRAPMCYCEGELLIGNSDIEVGEVNGVKFYMSEGQFCFWEYTHLILDVVKGFGGQFSLQNGTGSRFFTRARLYSDAERAYLDKNSIHHCCVA